ncbi:MAG: hypothetical protein JSR58_00445 [Verrucomicrobia bacterium]|nr:hypothetical protein [Verrucomicrobiota bacterium]
MATTKLIFMPAYHEFVAGNDNQGMSTFQTNCRRLKDVEALVYWHLWNSNNRPRDGRFGEIRFHENNVVSNAQQKYSAVINSLSNGVPDECKLALLSAATCFSRGNIDLGLYHFQQITSSFEKSVYWHLWSAKGAPRGNRSYGHDCFYNLHGLSATTQEKAQAMKSAFIERGLNPNIPAEAFISTPIEQIEPIQQALDCPINRSTMTNPHIAFDCGHTFEVQAILDYLPYSANQSCPLCRRQIQTLAPNLALQSVSAAASRAGLVQN